jgi:hypothetical protein
VPRLLRVALRAGYYHDKLGEIRDLTYGAGLRIVGVTIDWASIPETAELPRVDKYTFGFHFDPLIR